MRTLRRICLIVILVCLLPIFSLLLSIGIAQSNGCELNEGNVNPCVVLGLDLGGALYGLSVLGWLGLATLPIAALTAGGWIVAEIVNYIRSRKAS